MTSLMSPTSVQPTDFLVSQRSNEERRAKLMSRLQKADAAIDEAKDDMAEDTIRALNAENVVQSKACGELLILDGNVIKSKEKTAEKLKSCLPAFDVPLEKLTPEELAWARSNIGRIIRFLGDTPKGPGRASAIVDQIRTFRATFAR